MSKLVQSVKKGVVARVKAGENCPPTSQGVNTSDTASDIYSAYEKALADLLEALSETHPRHAEFLLFKHRLLENIANSRLYGDNATRTSDRNEIIHQLNQLAKSEIGRSFTETVVPAHPSKTTPVPPIPQGTLASRILTSACVTLLLIGVLLLFSELAEAILTIIGLVVGLLVFFFPVLRRLHLQPWFSHPMTVAILVGLTLSATVLDGFLLLGRHKPPLLPSELPMAFIRGGTFKVGLDSGVSDPTTSDESPGSSVRLNNFWIGVTEVTNAQYRSFIIEEGYTDSTLWTMEGYSWRERNGVTGPQYWQDPRYNADNLPVVGISWFEAIAFTNWLGRKTGFHYRLPTEAEWERAACGDVKRVYPWGNTWDGTRANYADRSLRDAAPDFEWADTSYSDNYVYAAPVGSYPSGITPEGVLDLAGNVWEWTSSLYWAYPYQEKDGRENAQAIGNRSLRGGGWGSDAPLLRCTNRRGEKPELRFDHTGFRVVRDP